MGLLDSANTIAEKALVSYINSIDYTALNDVQAVEYMEALIQNKDYTNAQIVVDYFLENGLTFSRDSLVTATYTTAWIPSVYLKFVSILDKIYKYTQDLTYDTEAQSILATLNANMVVDSGDYDTEPLSTAVLLFDAYGNCLSFKSGTYISDMNPYSWYLKGYPVAEQVKSLYDAQLSFQTSTGSMGLLTPFYVRNLPENTSYGTEDTFIFGGCLDDDTRMYHQYESVLNIAKYYYGRYKQNSDRDIKAKVIIDKFLTFMATQDNSYLSLVYSIITTDSDLTTDDAYANTDSEYSEQTLNYNLITTDTVTITTDLENITTNSLFGYTLSGIPNLGDICRLGLIAILKYQIDFEDETYNLATDIYDSVIAQQQSDGSILEYPYNVTNQCLALQFIAFYNQINTKSYYDIINSALRLYNIGEINDNNAETHEEKGVFEYCQIGMETILGDRHFGFSYTNTTLPWVAGQYSWHLPDYGIEMHRIGVIDFYVPTRLYEPFLFNYQTWLMYHDKAPTLTGIPLRYAINPGNETLYVHPIPDKDYSINVVSYKLEPYITDFNSSPNYLPPMWQHALKYFIAYKIGVNRDSPLGILSEIKYSEIIRLMEYADATGSQSLKRIPANVSFNTQNASSKRLQPFSAWEGR